MKKQYFLHRQNEPMQSDTVVYHVWVGESEREQKKLSALKSWAFQNGATLRPWSEDVDYYLLLESERVFPAKGIINFGFVSDHLNVADALRHAEANDWPVYENNLVTAKSFFHMNQVLDRPAVKTENHKITHSNVLTSQRKNLSESFSERPSIIRFI